MSSNSTDLAYRRSEDRAASGVPITIVCPAVALVFVALRIYTRAFLIRKLFWEDYIIVVAMAFSIFMSVFLVIAFSNGAGRHFETVSADEFARIRKFAPAVYVGYIAVHAFLKLSILLQYIRISVMPFEKRLCYAIAAFLGCGYFSFFLAAILSCRPLYAMWTLNVPGAVCINTAVSFPASQIWNIVMDFIILIAPAFILRHLRIPWTQRVILALVLALGSLASIVSILRLQVLYQSATSADKTWDSVPSGLYAVIESNIGIACACVVTLRPVFGRCLRRRRAADEDQQQPQLSLRLGQQQQQHRLRKDHVSACTDSTQVLSVSNDVELAPVSSNSYAGSTAGTSAVGEDVAGEPSAKGSAPVVVTVGVASPAAASAPPTRHGDS